MARIRKVHKVSLPVTIAFTIVLAAIFYLALSDFLERYRSSIYNRVIESNISALTETTDTLISKTTDGFDHCQHEVRVLGIGISEQLREKGFTSTQELSNADLSYLSSFKRISDFDYCVLLNESGRGIYSDGETINKINLYSSQAYVDCLTSPEGEAISFISDPLSPVGKDVVAFSYHIGAVILIGIYSQDSFSALYDSTTFGEHASYLITTATGLILSSAHVNQEVKDTLNLFAYFEEEPRNAEFFELDDQGQSGYKRVLRDFQNGADGRAELYFQDALYELVYAPIPHTSWSFISCVSYDYITSDAAEINRQTIQLTFFIIALMLGLFLIIVVMLIFVLKASASREAVRRDRLFTLMTRYVPNVIIIADTQTGHIEYMSHNTTSVMGVTEIFSNLNDEHLFRYISPQDLPAVNGLIDSVRTGKCSSRSLTLHYTRPDNQVDIVLQLNGYLISEEDSRQKFITLTLEDITDGVRSRRRLEEALASEERANASKSTFLASMSHDIRTPLNAIIGLTTLALHQPDDSKKVTEYLSKIANSSQLLLGLINDVLDMSKIESGNMQLTETEFELGEWLESVISVIQSQTSVRGQHFGVRTRNVSHELLRGDTVRLAQILTNVLGNAVKFTPEGGQIFLAVTEISSPDPQCARFVFTVRDTGIGMSPEFVSHIFELFSREQHSVGNSIQGTGLGMAITKRIIDQMGGQIRVESEPGEGTLFTIELPIRLSDLKAPTLQDCRILVIGEPGSETDCAEAVRKFGEIGVTACSETGYTAAASLARAERTAGRPFRILFIPYKLFLYEETLTLAQVRRDFGEAVQVLTGFLPDEHKAAAQVRKSNFTHPISLPLFKMSLYRKLTALFENTQDEPNSVSGDLDGRRILLVEDNELNREIAENMLVTLLGAQVDTAVNGQEGYERFENSPENTYDLILMDLKMPVLGGLEAARKIRAGKNPKARFIPIIALTANAFEEDRKAAQEAGMNGFISKPINLSELAKEITRVMHICRPLHLLLAEDNAINREIAVELILGDGSTVDAAENGKLAVERYLASDPGTYDAVLLDLHMPVMDGFEAVRLIRDSVRPEAGTIPIIALTASRKDEVSGQAAQSGFSAVLSKPVDMEKLRLLL